jgi:hypothetical protein
MISSKIAMGNRIKTMRLNRGFGFSTPNWFRGPVLGSFLFLVACGAQGEVASDGVESTVSATSFTYAGPVLDLPLDPDAVEGERLQAETERDWQIAAGTVAWARSQGLQGLPVADLVVLIGTTFVGTPYAPATLELPGEERLVVNLQTFDCVTFVEHVLVLADITQDLSVAVVAGEASPAFRDAYRARLVQLRYRNGVLDGYGSRLHYFTEWMNQAAASGSFVDVTRELGGVDDPRRIHFMTSNPQAYRQLGESPALLEVLAKIEGELSEIPRYFIPQDQMAGIETQLQNGDVIAAVSTVEGLDIAHTGFAIRHEGRVHLLHAPLVDGNVEITALPLVQRIQGIRGQHGIRVLRAGTP